jgi:hypothetical protein
MCFENHFQSCHQSPFDPLSISEVDCLYHFVDYIPFSIQPFKFGAYSPINIYFTAVSTMIEIHALSELRHEKRLFRYFFFLP